MTPPRRPSSRSSNCLRSWSGKPVKSLPSSDSRSKAKYASPERPEPSCCHAGLYLFAVLSRQVLFVDAQVVVAATVMSPRAVTVYTLPPTNETAGLVTTFVADPVYRVLRSYAAPGTLVNAPAPL